jgi:hypothetical protein
MNILDIITIIIIIVIIGALAFVNMSATLDQKLSNISVSIPPITIPESNITIKVQKTCGSDDYNVFVEKVDSKSVSISPITNNKNNEHFGSVSGSQPISLTSIITDTKNLIDKIKIPTVNEPIQPNAKEEKVHDVKINHDTKPVVPNTVKHVEYPDSDDMIEYGDYQCYRKPTQTQQSIHPLDAKKEVKIYYEHHMQKDASINDDDWDPNKYYKQYQHYVNTYMEDPKTRGYNVTEYDQYGGLSNIGRIKLDKPDGRPKPVGYLFENTPSFIR